MWQLWALLSAFFAALASVTAKIAVKHLDSVFVATLRAIAMAVVMLAISSLTGKFNLGSLQQESVKGDLLFIVLAAISGALSWTFYFTALKTGTVKGVYAIDKLSSILVVILALVFLKEKITLQAVLGAILLTGGAYLMSNPFGN